MLNLMADSPFVRADVIVHRNIEGLKVGIEHIKEVLNAICVKEYREYSEKYLL